jgi:hypothetical protein
LKLKNPTDLLVEVLSTDHRFKGASRPVVGQFVESADPNVAGRFEKGKLVKGWPFSIRFADAILIAEPVQSMAIEGDDWRYEIE